jgi:hypothetical protein
MFQIWKISKFSEKKLEESFNETSFDEMTKHPSLEYTIDMESLQNRMLRVCYVPATSAGLPRVSFFSFLFFVAAAINSTNEV